MNKSGNRAVLLKALIPVLVASLYATVPGPAAAQHQTLFPGLTGNELVDSLRVHYRPSYVMSGYDQARDHMFGVVHLDENNTLTCVYSGDRITWNPNSGLTARAFAQQEGWNTEHIWPQSMGAGSGNARVDLHHLRPIRADVNTSRSNYPFTFLEPAEVTRWWRGNVSQTSIPDGDLSEWSRTRSTSPPRFEVMDGFKGDVARAMFYFYTMYPDEARSADPNYLYLQMDDLRSYHNIDPVNEEEVGWTMEVAEVQDGKPNPFVIDTTLIRRAYFENYEQWDPSDGHDLEDPDEFLVTFTFAGGSGCGDENADPVIPDNRVNASPMQREGISCNTGASRFNSRQWPASAERSESHYAHFTITSGSRLMDLSQPASFRYTLLRSATGPRQFAWYYRVDGGQFRELESGTLTGTSDYQREITFHPPEEEAGELEFRLYGWEASSGAGTMSINELHVGGQLKQEPTDPAGVFRINIDSDYRGWRMMSMPAGGVTWCDLALQNRVQGITGLDECYEVAFPGAGLEHGSGSNLFLFARNGDAREWAAPRDIYDEITPGSGFIWYFFNTDQGPSKAFPFLLKAEGGAHETDVEITLEPGWNLLGNPFGRSLDRSSIVYLDAQGNETGQVTALQVWDPEAGGGLGSYRIPDPDEPISAWQGFVVQPNGADRVRFRIDGVNDAGNSDTPLTYGGDAVHHNMEGRPVARKSGAINPEQPGIADAGEYGACHIRFSLSGTDAGDGYRTVDHALSLVLLPEGAATRTYDMPKLPPLGRGHGVQSRHAVIAFQDGHRGQMAQLARTPGETGFSIPIVLERSDMSGEFELRWEGAVNLSTDLELTLEDRLTGELIAIAESGKWTFTETETFHPDDGEPRFVLHAGLAAPTDADSRDGQLPDHVTLHQNYPNPFNPVTVIAYELPQSGPVRLAVYDLLGRRVAMPVSETQQAGRHRVTFDASRLSSGVYLYRLEAAGTVVQRRMTIVK
ncbi:endonuclease [Balneolales bacterium ANBcel1]|nr:endonuclease [Balneolales bacterium ANBcel1]